MVDIVDTAEHGEESFGRLPARIMSCTVCEVGREVIDDLRVHTKVCGTAPGEVIGLDGALVVFRGHVYDEVGAVASSVALVGVGVTEWVGRTWLDTLPLETCCSVRGATAEVLVSGS